ncbi:NF045616 family extracytoplasmic (lipo)protein [Acinetobacter stercoris]|uniref:Uncharacterized protein n=1 Tax=Acinetobacter stercoris TaxID=2126983 RepID=A0A2U3MUM4_9GAMM|nr:NF045616 family extracytoplasmic (lipo)protein [Acinetobacter stercoris]SPL69126.1 hypothetical protein KPC_0304 [Acinetobacter stercoris]
MAKSLNLIKKEYLVIILIGVGFISNTQAVSTPYKGGKVEVSIKENTPCFSISNVDEKGDYTVVVLNLSKKIDESWSYESNFQRNYPSKNNCILLNKSNFNQFNKIQLNSPYNVTIGGVQRAYGLDFCVALKNNQYEIHDYMAGKCTKREISLWEKFLNWLGLN